ncbi:hypothetical protein WN51_13315 [Melipona quadrifasciata]|uniref:Uncharacterized protein n=1 Tax=Melipona quadrifasciata TaxID=166423 RepID=A0A0N0U5L0_9HYME|nr:hypothetical protein WN51_13315 [Melipona quadrifasciata]
MVICVKWIAIGQGILDRGTGNGGFYEECNVDVDTCVCVYSVFLQILEKPRAMKTRCVKGTALRRLF